MDRLSSIEQFLEAEDLTILTAGQARYANTLADAHRDKCCLAQCGRQLKLFIASSYQNDHAVLSLKELLRLDGAAFEQERVDVQAIQRLYQRGSRQRGSERNIRQRQVLDLIKGAVELRASDIHFRNKENHTEILMRIDGRLDKVETLQKEDGRELCGAMYPSMCDVSDEMLDERKCQDGRLKREFLSKIGLTGARISTRPMDYGFLMVLRLLGSNTALQSLPQLGFHPRQVPLIDQMVYRADGIILLSGPTGAGKSMTLKLLAEQILKRFDQQIHLLTIENPPEYEIQGAVQTPLLCDSDDPQAVAREWARSIANSMRLDPDGIVPGEIRDLDSAVAAIRAAITGHFVLSTIHAKRALQSLDRLRDIGADLNLITDATVMTGLINQSLVACNCPACRRPYVRHQHDLDAGLQARIHKYCDPARVYLRGNDKGCKTCGGKGILGRTLVAEVIEPTQRLLDAYRSGGGVAARRYWLHDLQGLSRAMHLAAQINSGQVDPRLGEEVCLLNEDELIVA